MAPKQDAYAVRDALLTEIRPHDFDDIARWLAAGRQITHSGGLRHAFARLDVNDVIRLEQECAIWRARMLPPPVVGIDASTFRDAEPAEGKGAASGLGIGGV